MAEAKKQKVDEHAVIREMILNGQIHPNERLVEQDYADRLGTNRANIRRALARLEQEGLVVCEPFRGAHVRNVSEEEAVEIFETRGVLEVMLVRRAVENATKADKEALQKMLRELNEAMARGDVTTVGRGSRRIREKLWTMSRHGTAARILNTLNSNLVSLWFRARHMPGRAEEMLGDLTALVEAVVAGDADAALRAMRKYHKDSVAAVKRATALARSRGADPVV